MKTQKTITILALFICFLQLTACGGGGGGGSGPARAKIYASPSGIDSGDTVAVRASLRGFVTNEIAVKFRYPNNFAYLRFSSLVTAGDFSDDTGPYLRESDDNNTYLIFKIDTDELGLSEDDELEITFSLVGQEDLPSGSIEIDVDENLGEKKYNFDISAPKFTAQADASVHIGPAPSPTPSENQT